MVPEEDEQSPDERSEATHAKEIVCDAMSSPVNAIKFFDLSRKRKQELEERVKKEEKESLPNLSLEVF